MYDLILIPKPDEDSPQKVGEKNCRLLSLMNTDVKRLHKILVTRIQYHLKK